MQEFSASVSEKIGFYVYCLIDPRDDKTFYIGKGEGNRVFAHANAALSSSDTNDKLDTIRAIQKQGLAVRYTVLRHGLTPEVALEVESALIDYVGLDRLTNIVSGHDSDERGKMDVSDIIAKYDAPEADITVPAILITINRKFKKGMSADDLYSATRGDWVMGPRRHKAKYAFAVFHGIIRAVYEIKSWTAVKTEHKRSNRWQFEGIVAENLQHYVGGSTVNYSASQNPIRYINCEE